MVVLPQPFGAQFAKDKQWGSVTAGNYFNFPISFSSAVYAVTKSAKYNTNGNNYLMKEAAVGAPSTTGFQMPSTSPALTFFIVAIGR